MAGSSLLRHIRNYASASVLAALAGIITFPLLTRSLTVAEYGILGLITSSLTLFVAFGKLGIQHAVIRYYAQIKNNNLAYGMNQLNSTLVMLFVMFSVITTALWLFAGFVLVPQVSDFDNISSLFLIASSIVFLRLLGSGLINYLRAQQRSAVVSFALILTRYLYLAMVLGAMFFSSISVATVLVAMAIAEIIGIGFAGRKFWPDFHFKPREITATLAKAMLIYGLPLMILESLGLVMRLSDRYIIQAMLGENALGMYSASYNLTAYLDFIILGAMVQALKPYYMQLWEVEGVAETKAFLSSGFRLYTVVGIPLIALFSLVSPHLLNFLASDKYSPGTVIIPFIAISFLLEGATHFLAAGLYVKKNTKVLMFWGVVATVLNLGLNLLIIPVYGILGAAVVTIISYTLFMLGISWRSFKLVPFDIDFRAPLLIALLSLIIYALLVKLDFGGDFTNLMVKGALGVSLLGAMIIVIDGQIRVWLLDRIRTLKPNAAE